MNKQELLLKYGGPIKVGPSGFIRLVDVMGDDTAIAQAARTSYGKGTKAVSEDRGLLRYLMRAKHTTPFEMCEIKLHVKVPMDTWRQWIRTRNSSTNEQSTRYSEAVNEQAHTLPNEWRLQSANNKQGSAGLLIESNPVTAAELSSVEDSTYAELYSTYEKLLAAGIAREQARKILPLSTYTQAYWKIDLHNLLHFLHLRLDPHAQQEIREYAQAIHSIVKDWVPATAEAFEDYILGAQTFSKQEMIFLREMCADYLSSVDTEDLKWNFDKHGIETKRERIEFLHKLGKTK